jgi:hypothetical protein
MAWDMKLVGDGLVPHTGVFCHVRHVGVWIIHQHVRVIRLDYVVALGRKNNAVFLPGLLDSLT